MTDINKLKLLINAEIIENKSNYALFNEGMKKGAGIAQSIILHHYRWRKVSDLLELKEFGFHILTRVPNEEEKFYYTTIYLGNTRDLDVLKYMLKIELGKDSSYGDHLEWKPIE